jgi:hypothetical protein
VPGFAERQRLGGPGGASESAAAKAPWRGYGGSAPGNRPNELRGTPKRVRTRAREAAAVRQSSRELTADLTMFMRVHVTCLT